MSAREDMPERAIGRERRPVTRGWSFRRAGAEEWLPATVPGSNFSDLRSNGLIENPFAGDAENRLQWVEREDWEYRCAIEVSVTDLATQSIELVFEGLDTLCTANLNGQPLLTAANMFWTHRVECRPLLHAGTNELRLRFESPVTNGAERRRREGLLYPAENDKTDDHVSVYVRNAPYQFGWDWGPKYVTSGVWRPVSLDLAPKARIRGCSHDIVSLSGERAEVIFTVETESYVAGEAAIECACEQAGLAMFTIPVTLSPGVQTHRFTLMIDHPKLWWPNGLGEAFLYRFSFCLADEGGSIDETCLAIGLRSIEVVREPDEFGKSFALRINGRPVFMKGANYIPLDSFQENITPERYRRLFADAVGANMNMLRVWGGGTYERDLFYDLADEHGILIWQDFMFACTLYPSDEAFLDNVAEEAVQAVRRLRHHASLALWCGNNEIGLGIKQWDWPTTFGYSDDQFARMVEANERLFEELLPAMIAEHDPGRFYLPSSPTGNWQERADDARGNSHYWGVWHGERPFATYAERVPRFMTEFGFQSYPLLESIQQFTAEEDRELGSAVLGVHQKHPRGDAIIARFVREAFGEPRSFEHFCYLSQLVQADGLRIAFEAHRRAMPYCMGSLYWQLNDCWPAISWSSIDYYGRWKALHYQAARSFAPLLLSLEIRDDTFLVHAVSDEVEDVAATLTVEAVDFDGQRVWTREAAVTVPANRSSVVLRWDADELKQIDRRRTVLVLRLADAAGPRVSSIIHLESARLSSLSDPKLRAEVVDERTVRISAQNLARSVLLSAAPMGGGDEPLQFEENFLDLLAGEERIVRVRGATPIDPATLKVMSLYEAVRGG